MNQKITDLKNQGFYEKTRNTNALGQLEVVMYKHELGCYVEVTLREV
jgi:hypothetical protein